MKRLALVAAVLSIASVADCSSKEKTADTATPARAPAPAQAAAAPTPPAKKKKRPELRGGLDWNW